MQSLMSSLSNNLGKTTTYRFGLQMFHFKGSIRHIVLLLHSAYECGNSCGFVLAEYLRKGYEEDMSA